MMFVRVHGRGIDLHLLLCCSVTEFKSLLTDQLNINTQKKRNAGNIVCALALLFNWFAPAAQRDECPSRSRSHSVSSLSSLPGSLVLDHSANQQGLIRFKCQER